MNALPAWFYNELQQVGVDFEDTAQVAVFDRNQTSSTIEPIWDLIQWTSALASSG
jgi:glyceraldehyde-3-phosphate dehydrogenase/erythrose-4-phosphate dehydrogenase